MEVEYMIKELTYDYGSYKSYFLKKLKSYAESLLRENSGERVIVTNTELNPTETLRNYINICVIDEIIYVYWYKEGKLHREDGPAYIRYDYVAYEFKQMSERYYHEGNYCCKLYEFESEKNNLERNFGYLVLDAGKINNKIIWLKILGKESIEDRYYWLI